MTGLLDFSQPLSEAKVATHDSGILRFFAVCAAQNDGILDFFTTSARSEGSQDAKMVSSAAGHGPPRRCQPFALSEQSPAPPILSTLRKNPSYNPAVQSLPIDDHLEHITDVV